MHILLTPKKIDMDCAEFICELLDINNEDDVMAVCGSICVNESFDGVCNVTITLFENFKSLCVGDSYIRKHFVETIMFLLQSKTFLIIKM